MSLAHVRMIRRGECRRCGRCCAGVIGECPFFVWVALEDIQKGTVIKETGVGTPLKADCLIFDKPVTWRRCTLQVRRAFPSQPQQVAGRCGFWFEDEKGRRLVAREVEPGKFVVEAVED